MDFEARKFQTSTAVAAAGCKAVTLRAWRNRNNLFPETKENRAWNYFSIVDICIIRSIVVMTEHGIPADDAVWHAEHIQRMNFREILKGAATPHLAGFFPGAIRGDDDPLDWIEPRCTFIAIGSDDAAGPLLNRTKGIITIVDLYPIIEHVLAELAALAPETIATEDEAKRLIFTTLANAIRPKPDNDGGAE